jgi:hypothetical protein
MIGFRVGWRRASFARLVLARHVDREGVGEI